MFLVILLQCKLGESGLGKTTFINTLFTTILKEPVEEQLRHQKQISHTVEINITRVELEEKGFTMKLTLIDTPGFGDYVNNKDCWVPVARFIDQRYENYLRKEDGDRLVSGDDLRVHACLYFISPNGHTLKSLDIEAMKQISSRVNLIPVIGKSDCISKSDLYAFKQRIRDCLAYHNIQVYSPLIESDDEDNIARNQSILDAMPYAVVGGNSMIEHNGSVTPIRQYPWGNVILEDEEHCDFKKLRNLLIRTYMHDLLASTSDIHYEGFRESKLLSEGHLDSDNKVQPRRELEQQLRDKEESLRRQFTEQVRLKEQEFRQWEQRLIAERDRLNKDLEQLHKYVKSIEMNLTSTA